MHFLEVRRRARNVGVCYVGTEKKADLIHAIQKLEGNLQCFRGQGRHCCKEYTCLWRDDCQIV